MMLVQQRIEYKVCVLVYKCLHQAASTYLAELCSSVSESANRGHLRSAARGDLEVTKCTHAPTLLETEATFMFVYFW